MRHHDRATTNHHKEVQDRLAQFILLLEIFPRSREIKGKNHTRSISICSIQSGEVNIEFTSAINSFLHSSVGCLPMDFRHQHIRKQDQIKQIGPGRPVLYVVDQYHDDDAQHPYRSTFHLEPETATRSIRGVRDRLTPTHGSFADKTTTNTTYCEILHNQQLSTV